MGRGMGVGLELRGKTCSGIINPMDHTHDLNAVDFTALTEPTIDF